MQIETITEQSSKNLIVKIRQDFKVNLQTMVPSGLAKIIRNERLYINVNANVALHKDLSIRLV